MASFFNKPRGEQTRRKGEKKSKKKNDDVSKGKQQS